MPQEQSVRRAGVCKRAALAQIGGWRHLPRNTSRLGPEGSREQLGGDAACPGLRHEEVAEGAEVL
eukprot:7397195-Heterocapsa_arctica.AAC.1